MLWKPIRVPRCITAEQHGSTQQGGCLEEGKWLPAEWRHHQGHVCIRTWSLLRVVMKKRKCAGDSELYGILGYTLQSQRRCTEHRVLQEAVSTASTEPPSHSRITLDRHWEGIYLVSVHQHVCSGPGLLLCLKCLCI